MSYFSVEPEAKPVKNTDMAGVVVLTGPGRYRHFLYDLQTRAITELPGNYVDYTFNDSLRISPDRSSLAYTEMTSQGTVRVYVVSEGGASITPHVIPNEGRYLVVGWLDDVFLGLADVKGNDGAILAMNSSDGALSRLAPPFPLSTENGPLAWGVGELYAQYNRSRSHVVTARWIDNQTDVEPLVPMRYTYELWDADTPRLLWTASGGGFSGPPVWDTSGGNFLVAYPPYRDVVEFGTGCSEVHVVSTQAEDRMLDQCTWRGGYSWSPDGSLVAAWEGWRFTGWDSDSTFREARLRVFDLAHNSATEYLLRFAVDTIIERTQPPTWSPDARFLAFSEMDEENGRVRSWVLDLETGIAGVLMSGTRVEGWLQQPR